jgi:hypothetical protein
MKRYAMTGKDVYNKIHTTTTREETTREETTRVEGA